MLPEYVRNIKNKQNTTVYVAMSGGVDSSVAAALLKEANFRVVGCFINVWQPPFLDCSQKTERRDAMQVAAHLDIPFKTIDLAEEYKNKVVDYMISEYRAGRTPNPDIICNSAIKFGAFYDFAKDKKADYVATGHYAQIKKSKIKNKGLQTKLLAGEDERKDQTYFLWQLSQDRLENSLFPVGHLKKDKVRELADKLEIPVAEKKDSQGLCFLGQVDMQTFLDQFIDTKPGNVLNEKGQIIGTHQGAEVYTIGQRHGFTVTEKKPDSGPWYVSRKNIATNTVTVSENNQKSGPLYNGRELVLEKTNWINKRTDQDREHAARIRYNQKLEPCRIESRDGKSVLVFTNPLKAIACGQSAVVYQGNECLGGGIINQVSK